MGRRSVGAKQLAELREQGYAVRVDHERPAVGGDNEVPILSAYGGKTKVSVFAGDDENREIVLATGEALCRPDERFDRKLGFTIAMGRAVKELNESSDL